MNIIRGIFLGCWIASNPVELVAKMKIMLNDWSLYENEGWRSESRAGTSTVLFWAMIARQEREGPFVSRISGMIRCMAWSVCEGIHY